MVKLRCKKCGQTKYSAADFKKCTCGGDYREFRISQNDLFYGHCRMHAIVPLKP